MSYVLLNKATNQFAKLASYIGKRAEHAVIQDNMNFDMRESIESDVIKILESINTLNGTSSAAKYVNDVYVKQKNNDEYFVEVIFSSECNYDYEREELYLDYSDFDNMVNEYMRKASEKFDVVATKIVDEETISGYNHDEIKFPEHKEKTVKMLVKAVDISKSASEKRCNCENDECAGHKAGSCKNHAGKRKALYVGALCDECAENMPKEFMKE